MYPGSIPSYNTPIPGETLAAGGHTALHIAEESDLVALATKMGTGSSTPSAGSVLRANGTGTSVWGAADLKHDVTGILPTANGGTGNGSLSFPSGTETVVGRAVAETLSNKTLLVPVIASFTNATHTHQNNAGGGLLALAAFLSTAFSSQVVSGSNAGTAGGTTNYINIGGLIICWGKTNNCSALANNGNQTLTVTLPATYTSAPSALLTVGEWTVDARVIVGHNSAPTTTGLAIEFQSVNGTANATANANWITIGV